MTAIAEWSDNATPTDTWIRRRPLDPVGGVRTTAQLRTARHADDRRPMLNQYIRGVKVGSGQHGDVLLCYDVNNNRQEVAIKAVKRHNPRAEKWSMMRKKNLPSTPHTPLTERLGTTEHKIRKEIAIMKKCRHGHVVRLLEVIDDKLKEKIYMVRKLSLRGRAISRMFMEYLGGGEVKWMNSNHEPIQTVDQTRRIIRDVILGLEYLHYQGIIHRDIKPANLLWTADRSRVKISDFGVSHFSYAQRLAAAGRDQDALDNPHDPILLDDSDLSKTAGTPSFLAPEVVFDSSTDASPINSPNNTFASPQATLLARTDLPAARRPPITKSIDIWALGITLYCLLFGKTPFQGDQNEWVMYKAICTQDWDVADSMGFDQISTGGRHPKNTDSEGFIVVDLLDQLLQKDCRQRVTLDEVKRHHWFTRDLHDAERWLRETSPNKHDMVMVTESETTSAMSTVRFRWNWGRKLTHQISTFLRTAVRQRPARDSSRPSRSNHRRERDGDDVGVRSLPQELTSRSSMTKTSMSTSHTISSSAQMSKRAKGKRPATDARGKYRTTVRSKSIERWPMSRTDNSLSILTEKPRVRRGSETVLASSQPACSSKQTTLTVSHNEDALRQRFFLSNVWRWGFNRYPSHGTSASASNWPVRQGPTSQSTVSMDPIGRNSEEAYRHHRTAHNHSGGPLTAARRASSWGENSADFVEEVTSLNSDDHEIDEDAMLFGAGGICNDRSQLTVNPRPDVGSGNLARQSPDRTITPHPRHQTTRSLNTSPLTQVAYESETGTIGDKDVDEFDDYSSVEDSDECPDEDDMEDDSEDDAAPIEVRRRFPSSPPPCPPESDDENS